MENKDTLTKVASLADLDSYFAPIPIETCKEIYIKATKANDVAIVLDCKAHITITTTQDEYLKTLQKSTRYSALSTINFT